MTYENSERYLLLKQLLVVFTLVRKGASVTVGGITYDEPTAVSCITNLLDEIEESFTIPYGLLSNKPIHLELEDIALTINTLCDDCIEDGPLLDAINALTDNVNLEEAILKYPIKNVFLQMRQENIDKDIMFHNARYCAGELIQASVNGIDSIRKWIVFQNKMCLQQCIILSNCVELIDWVFSYSNDVYGVENESTE